MDHRSLVFASVFSVPLLSHTTPTPIATPEIGNIAPGASFGSPFTNRTNTSQHRAVRRNLAWSTATRFLSLPKTSNSGSYTSFHAQSSTRSHDVEEALQYLLVGDGQSDEDAKEEGLVEWYTNETRIHFATYVRPALAELWKRPIELRKAWDVLLQTQQALERVQKLYLQPFNDHILSFLLRATTSSSTIRSTDPGELEKPTEAQVTSSKYRRDIHAVFAHCLPQQQFSKTLGYILYDAGCRIFSFHIRQDGLQPSPTPENVSESRKRMVSLLRGLEQVGLGGDNAQTAFAHAMDRLLDSFIGGHYSKVDWYSKRSIVPHLRLFIKDGFTPLVELVMECLRCDPSTVQPSELQVWQDMALGRLGRARVENMFDFVINWKKSLGAILDIKEYLKVPGGKQHLTSSFAQQISRRLLHPGATTTYILNVYISVIRTFHELEPKGVLLERVARPIRRYLKEREDTARIIIASLLADVNDETGGRFVSAGELSLEIASEMQKPFALNFSQQPDDELDWNDMSWQPLPTDASPEYKKSKVEDVIWFLLTLWEREDFINELRNILGDHLLRCQDPDYEKEIRLLELIKVRLGDDKLQACEVMLRDVLESKRINATVRAGRGFGSISQQLPSPQTPDNAPGPRTPRPRRQSASKPLPLPLGPSLKPPPGPALNAQVLSSFFWPLLRDDRFIVPGQIQTLQKEYESRFERIKGMRKLQWMNALGDSTVTLEFEDRVEEFERLLPWQVCVIHAFQPQPGEEWTGGRGRGKAADGGIARNVEQLEEMLQMDEQLVRQALAFWVGQSVLRETQLDTFEVIENRTAANTDADAAAAAQELAQVQAEAQAGAVRSQEDLLMERKEVYESFIFAMLTAQGSMNVQRILMMMRTMVQGGFPFGADEVKMLLTDMEGAEKVVSMGADMWVIRK